MQPITPYLLYEDGEASVTQELNDKPFGAPRCGCTDPHGHGRHFAPQLDA